MNIWGSQSAKIQSARKIQRLNAHSILEGDPKAQLFALDQSKFGINVEKLICTEQLCGQLQHMSRVLADDEKEERKTDKDRNGL